MSHEVFFQYVEAVAASMVYANLCFMAWRKKVTPKFFQQITWFVLFVAVADKLELISRFVIPK